MFTKIHVGVKNIITNIFKVIQESFTRVAIRKKDVLA